MLLENAIAREKVLKRMMVRQQDCFLCLQMVHVEMVNTILRFVIWTEWEWLKIVQKR